MLDVEIDETLEPIDFLKKFISIVKEAMKLLRDGYITREGLRRILWKANNIGRKYLETRRE